MTTSCPVKPTVVVAGYGSWAKAAINPATEVVAALKQLHPEHYVLHCLDIPVDSFSLYERLEIALQEYTPDIWIGIGVAVESPTIRLEAIGINIRCFDVPDINGLSLKPTTVIDDGPIAYQSGLTNEEIVNELRSSGIPAVLSFHAGTHLCNQMLYSILHLGTTKSLNLLSGFVHVPQSADNVACGSEAACSSMSVSMMTSALEITVDNAVRQFTEMPHPLT